MQFAAGRPPITRDRLRRHGLALALAVLAPFVALGTVLLVLSSTARPHETTVQQVSSPAGDRSVVVQRTDARGAAVQADGSGDGAVTGQPATYVLTLQGAGRAERMGCVQGASTGQPLVQWLGDDAVRVSVLDAGRTVATTLSWDAGAPPARVREMPRLAALHAC